MLTGEIFDIIEKVAPLSLQCDFDNSGLQIGGRDRQVNGIMLCLDLTPDVLDKANKAGCDLIITHHPLIFNAVKSISDSDYISSLIASAISMGMTVYSAHTNLDCASGGINDMLSAMAGIDVSMGKEGDFYRAGAIKPCSALEFASKIKCAYLADSVRLIGDVDNVVRCAAVSSGAGGRDEDMFDLLYKSGCDIIVTSEIKHNLAMQCAAQGKCAIEITHYDSEKHCVKLLGDILRTAGIDSNAAICSPYGTVI